MDDKKKKNEETLEPTEESVQSRRKFLISLGKWSAVVVSAAILGDALDTDGDALAQRRGSWVNRRGGGGWANRSGGGGWVNRGATGWVNRGGSWVNRSGGGGWINRRGGGGWLNRR